MHGTFGTDERREGGESTRGSSIPPVVLGALGAGALLRILHLLVFQDPFGSGPDAFNYHRGAVFMMREGLLATDVPHIPFAPAGYATMINLVYTWLAPEPIIVSLVQIALLAIGSWSAYRLIEREFDRIAATITLLLLSLSPALVALPTFLMYEGPFLAGIVVGVDLCSRAARKREGRLGMVLAAGVVFALTATLQPKILLGVLFLAAWLLWRTRRILVAVALVVATAAGPVALAWRNGIAEGHAVVSVNAGTNVMIGANPDATGGYVDRPRLPPTCPPGSDAFHEEGNTKDLIERDAALVDCSLEWALANPVRMGVLTVKKFLYFWSPMIGPIGESWMKTLDPRLALDREWTETTAFDRIDFVLRSLWTLVLVAAICGGIATAWKRSRAATLLFLGPVVAFVAATLITIGDPRLRLPVAPFYLCFIALLIEHRFASRRSRGTD